MRDYLRGLWAAICGGGIDRRLARLERQAASHTRAMSAAAAVLAAARVPDPAVRRAMLALEEAETRHAARISAAEATLKDGQRVSQNYEAALNELRELNKIQGEVIKTQAASGRRLLSHYEAEVAIETRRKVGAVSSYQREM